MEIKWKEAKAKADSKAKEIKTKLHWFYVKHEQEIWIFGLTLGPAIFGGVKAISKAVTAHNEEHHKLLMDYDPSMGWYNELSRPLTSQDKQMILELRNQGFNQTEALMRLNLLKK